MKSPVDRPAVCRMTGRTKISTTAMSHTVGKHSHVSRAAERGMFSTYTGLKFSTSGATSVLQAKGAGHVTLAMNGSLTN